MPLAQAYIFLFHVPIVLYCTWVLTGLSVNNICKPYNKRTHNQNHTSILHQNVMMQTHLRKIIFWAKRRKKTQKIKKAIKASSRPPEQD